LWLFTSFGPVRVNLLRPDVADHFREAGQAPPGVDSSGFEVSQSTLGLPQEFEVSLRVTLNDGDVVQFATIRATRTQFRSSFRPDLHPLMLISDGRSGTTWTSHLLGQHPEVLCYRPFVNESRVATYWMEVLAALAEPSSYLQALAASNLNELWWLGHKNGSKDSTAEPATAVLEDPEIDQWFRGQPSLLAAFCQERIQSFYEAVANIEEKPTATYFVEWSRPNQISAILSELYPQARQVFLVRDFRDKVTSTIAFRLRLGDTAYSRLETQQQHVRGLQTVALRMLHDWQRLSERAYLLRYEDLVESPHETLAKLLDYVGVACDADTAQQVLSRAQSTLGDYQRAHATSPTPRASIGRWRNELDPSVAELCEELLADPLRAFGYET
jgi:hypothetical protein